MKRGHRAKVEILIQWKGAIVEDATWEDEELQRRFPDFVSKIL